MNPNLAEKSEFCMLFKKHFKARSGRPATQHVRYGDYWTPKSFLDQLKKCGCERGEDIIAHWCNGTALPAEAAFEAILRVFFPSGSVQSRSQEEIDADREQMRLAYEEAKGRRGRQPKTSEPERPTPLDVASESAKLDESASGTAETKPQGGPKEEGDALADRRKLAKLKLIVTDILSQSTAAMDALASEMSVVAAGGTGADAKSRAKVLIERLMEANFDQSTGWLTEAHRKLDDSLEHDAMRVIENVSQHLLPFLLVLDPVFAADDSVQPSMGAIIPFPVGVETMAVIVLHGIARQRVTFAKEKEVPSPAGARFPVSPHTLQPGAPSGEHDMIIPNLRAELYSRLGLTSAYRGCTTDELDAGINDALATDIREKNIRWHYILELPESEAERSRLRSAWARAGQLFKGLSIIELDRRLITRDGRIVNSVRRVFGLLSE